MIHIVLICLAYVVGIIWGLYLDIILGIAFLCLNICLYIILKFEKYIKKEMLCLLFLSFFIGMIYSNVKIENFNSKYIDGNMEVRLKILSLNSEKEYYNTYIVKNMENDKFLLYVPNEMKIDICNEIYVKGIFEKPDKARNRGGFDYSKYLYSQNIYGKIKVNEKENVFIVNNDNKDFIYSIQKNIINLLGQYFPSDELGIILGMIIGNTSYISEEVENNFKISGITHLLAVSGSNISYIIIFTKFLFNKILGKKIANYVVIVILVIYMLVVGTTPSVVRATIMGIIIILADILLRKNNIYASISLSALIILLYNPLTIFDIGFILSFGGTLGIVLLYEKIKNLIFEKVLIENHILKYIVETFSVTLAAQLILLPIIAYNFNSISVVSIVVNLIVVPFSGFLTIIAILTYIVGVFFYPIGKFLSYIVFIFSKIIILVADVFSKVPYANLIVITPKISWIILYYLIIYIFFYNKDSKYLKCIVYFFVLLSIVIEVLPNNHLKVNFVDVGQGDCAYIETKNKKAILIDGGGSENSDYDVGENILLPYILDRRKMKIDLMIVSHIHEDHLEGLITIMNTLDVERIIMGPVNKKTELYYKFINVASQKGVQIETVYAGDYISLDDIKIEVVYPYKNEPIDKNENNNSLVLKFIYNDISILFTGDLEKKGEEKLKENIKANILKVAHHGSKTSSTEEFINRVNPQLSIIGVGENNKFRHPAMEVLQRLNNKSEVYRTDINGEIMIKLFTNKIKVKSLLD